MSAEVGSCGIAGTLERLAAMPDYLFAALARSGERRFATRPDGGGFSLVEHACHLRDLAREGRFAGRTVTLSDMVAMAASHDEEHRRDIERLLAQFG